MWQEGRAVELGGYYMGSLADFNITSASLLQTTGKPDSTYVQERSWVDALVEVNGGTPLSTKEKPDIVRFVLLSTARASHPLPFSIPRSMRSRW